MFQSCACSQAPVWCCRALAPVRKCTPAPRRHVSCLCSQLVHASVLQSPGVHLTDLFGARDRCIYALRGSRSGEKKIAHFQTLPFLMILMFLLVHYLLDRQVRLAYHQDGLQEIHCVSGYLFTTRASTYSNSYTSWRR